MTNTTNEELSPYKLDPELLEACIHCGLCLPACPTYQATGRETESPRGRIYLLNLWQRNELELTDRLVEHIDSCLGCLGCQTACPSGVQYEKILNQARPALAQSKSPASRKMMRYIFSKVLPDYGLLRKLAQVLRLWQRTGSDHVFDVLPWLKNILGKYNQWRILLPPVPKFEPLPRQSWAPGEKKGTVQLFGGCVMDVLYNQVNHACRRLLVAQQQVVNVPEQTCCGALAFHAGETDIVTDLAKLNIELFEATQGPIVVTAAGCGAMLKGYGELLENDNEWHERAGKFSSRVVDITEFLNRHEFSSKPKELKKKVAYHAACHLYHAQKVTSEPVQLLEKVAGLELIPLTDAEQCCGSAGIFNLTHTNLSMKVLAPKIAHIKESGADTVVTTNPGCLMQLEAGIKEAGLSVKAVHLAELLDQAYSAED